MSERLSALLIAERVLPAATVWAAAARQRVYGGGLDTALMELGALSEAAVWAQLAAVTGLPVPPPTLADGSEVATPPDLSPERTGPLRAVPMGSEGGMLRVLCAEPVAGDEIRRAASERGLSAKLYIIPETRLLALRQRVYGETLPQRYAPLLARAMGTMKARTSFARPRLPSRAPGPESAASFDKAPDTPARATLATMLDSALTPLERVLDLAPLATQIARDTIREMEIELGSDADLAAFADSGGVPVGLDPMPLIADESGPIPQDRGPTAAELLADTATEALCRRARSLTDRGRPLALRALRRRLEHPRALALLTELRDEAAGAEPLAAREAIETLGELRDEGAIPIFIHRLRDSAAEVVAAAREALLLLTSHDFSDAEQWGTWWLEHAWSPRTAWLLAALGDADETARRRAFDELRPLSMTMFGYAPDLPPDAREAARLRWIDWWRARGGAGLPEA